MRIILFSLLILSSLNSFSTKITSISSGDWSQGSTWDLNRTPSCEDTIVIGATHKVDISSDINLQHCNNKISILIEGILYFSKNGSKLRLPENAYVNITSTGLLDSYTYNGATNFIRFGNNSVWESKDGPQTGVSFGTAPLPIKLIAFNATPYGNSVILNWQTATEINNDYFTVERSADADNWEEVLYVAGAGNSNKMEIYTSTDLNPLNGTTYYRLKQTDFDGKFEYFNIVAVNLEKELNTKIIVYPNPAMENTSVSVEHNFSKNNSTITISVKNIEGKKMTSFVSDNTKTAIEGLPKGLYFVTVSTASTQQTEKLIIQ
jgi:hypothetical protein|tara:strand:+ start:133958 stop:134917 length:960 start_codon:yes stop_codon:yes gene_type:complete